MKKEKVDRRIQRTQKLLQDALMALILEKGYAAITVQNILDRANLGRSTFYVHYRDKDDLLMSQFEQLKRMFEEFDTEKPTRPGGKQGVKANEFTPSLAFFRHAGEQHRLYKALVGKQGGEVVQKYLYQYVTDLMRDHLKRRVPNEKNLAVPREVMAHHLVSSFLALLTWWLDHDMPYTAEQMDAMFRHLNKTTLQVLLETK